MTVSSPGNSPIVVAVNQTAPTANVPPSVTSITITGAQGTMSGGIRAVFNDNNGARDITTAEVLLGQEVSTNASCRFRYYPAEANFDTFDETLNAWTAKAAINAPLDNRYCNITVSSATLTLTSVIIDAALTFKAPFTGLPTVWGYATDASGAQPANWSSHGTWMIGINSTPSISNVQLSPSAGTSLAFSAQYTDPNGRTMSAASTCNRVEMFLDGSTTPFVTLPHGIAGPMTGTGVLRRP